MSELAKKEPVAKPARRWQGATTFPTAKSVSYAEFASSVGNGL